MGFRAYEIWIRDLLDANWYNENDQDQMARRFSVNQFCSLALFDARKAAYLYLKESAFLVPQKIGEMNRIIGLFYKIAEKAEKIHRLLDSGEYLEGEQACRFWTKEMREEQAKLLSQMLDLEREAVEVAEAIL